jgi:hypothetical protein
VVKKLNLRLHCLWNGISSQWRGGGDKTLTFLLSLQPGKLPKARSTLFVCFLQRSNRHLNKLSNQICIKQGILICLLGRCPFILREEFSEAAWDYVWSEEAVQTTPKMPCWGGGGRTEKKTKTIENIAWWIPPPQHSARRPGGSDPPVKWQCWQRFLRIIICLLITFIRYHGGECPGFGLLFLGTCSFIRRH